MTDFSRLTKEEIISIAKTDEGLVEFTSYMLDTFNLLCSILGTRDCSEKPVKKCQKHASKIEKDLKKLLNKK